MSAGFYRLTVTRFLCLGKTPTDNASRNDWYCKRHVPPACDRFTSIHNQLRDTLVVRQSHEPVIWCVKRFLYFRKIGRAQNYRCYSSKRGTSDEFGVRHASECGDGEVGLLSELIDRRDASHALAASNSIRRRIVFPTHWRGFPLFANTIHNSYDFCLYTISYSIGFTTDWTKISILDGKPTNCNLYIVETPFPNIFCRRQINTFVLLGHSFWRKKCGCVEKKRMVKLTKKKRYSLL